MIKVTEIWDFYGIPTQGLCTYEGQSCLFWIDFSPRVDVHEEYGIFPAKEDDFYVIDNLEIGDLNWWDVLRMDDRPLLKTVSYEELDFDGAAW